MNDATRALATFDQAPSAAARSQPRARNTLDNNDTRGGAQPASRADDNNDFKQAMKKEASKPQSHSKHDNNAGSADSGRATSTAASPSSDRGQDVAHQDGANPAVSEQLTMLQGDQELREHSIAVPSEQQALALSPSPNDGLDPQNSAPASPVNTISLTGQGAAAVLSSTDSAHQARLVQTTTARAAQPQGVLQAAPSAAQSLQTEHVVKGTIKLSTAVASASGDPVSGSATDGLPASLLSPKMGALSAGNMMASGTSGSGGGALAQSMLNQLTMRSASAQTTHRAVGESDKSFASYVEALAAEGQESTDYKPLTAQLEGSGSKTPAPATDRVFVTVNAKFGSPGWAEQLAERSANLASQNIRQAEIQLNPQEMGPIHIKISMTNDQAAVTFAAQNAAVREALDATMQRLKDAFDADGLELVQSDVKDQQHSSDQQPSQGEQGWGDGPGDSDDTTTHQIAVHVPRSAVDHFV
ncbi:MAG TPA: flagellar hook-length control protein FliK [Marinagarivorans sp.]